MHWIMQYLGKRWEAGARGPDAFDCWGLVYDFYKRFLGVELPAYQVLPSSHREIDATASGAVGTKQWNAVAEPEAFDVVCMGRRSIIHHVGLYIESGGGMILHIGDGLPAQAQKLESIKKEYRRIEFYRHASNN